MFMVIQIGSGMNINVFTFPIHKIIYFRYLLFKNLEKK